MNNASENQSFGAIAKGLLALAGVVFVGVEAVSFLVHNVGAALVAFFDGLSSLDAAIVVALITGCVSILTVVGGAIINNVLKSKHEREEYLRKHREEPYTQLVRIFYKMLSATKKGKEYSQESMLDDMMSFNQGLTLWGSSKAIKKWDEWRALSGKTPADPYALLHGMEIVLIQLRKDMGEKRGLKQGDLLKLFINDYDEAMRKNKGGWS